MIFGGNTEFNLLLLAQIAMYKDLGLAHCDLGRC